MAKALIVEIFGNAKQFTSELDRAAGKTRRFSAAAGVAGTAIVGGLAYGLEKSVVAASHFQSSMELIHTQAGVSQKSVDALGHSVLGLAGSVGTAPDELSAGLYHLASQGLRGKQAMDALRIASEGAKVGQANLEDVTNALGGVIVSGIKGAGDYSHAMGVLNATVGAGDMRMQDLADAMGTGLPAAAATAHIAITQIAGALATFGDNNIRGAKAGTLLISTMRVLGHQSNAGAAALKDLGVNSDVLQKKLAHGGLTTAIEYLKTQIDASGKSSQETSSMLSEAFGGKQSTGIKVLIQELDRLKGKVKDVGQGGQRFGSDWQAYSKTSAAATDRLKASLQAIEISLGSALLPDVADVTAKIAVFTDFLAKHTTIAKIAVGVIGTLGFTLLAVAAATKIAAASTALWSVATKAAAVVSKAFTAAQWLLNAALDANPIGIVVLALAALGVALVEAWKHSETFRRIVTDTWNGIKSAVQTVVNWFTRIVPAAFQTVLGWVQNHWPVIATLISGPFAPLVALATNAFGIRSKLEGAFDAMKTKASNIIGDIVGFFTSLPGKIGSAIASGASQLYHSFTELFSKLPGWAKDVLGIHSPSTVFKEIGQHIVSGLIHGMLGKAGDLRKAAEKILGHAVNWVTGKVKGVGSAVLGGIKDVGGAISGVFGGGGSGPLSANQALGKQMAAAMGWTGGQFADLLSLWNRESGWNNFARNPSSGAYGIPQALPPTKLPFAGQAAGGSHAGPQIAWGLNYIAGRYGSPSAALAHEDVMGWYGKGGIFTKPSIIGVGEAGPEAVVPLSRGGLLGGGAPVVNVTVNGWVGSDQDLARKLRDSLVKLGRHEPNIFGGFA